jgi:hypothetical protein
VLTVLLDQLGQRSLVDLADLGGDVVERVVAAELFARCRPPGLVGERLAGIVTLEGQRRPGSAPEGAVAFPDSAPASRGCSEAST